MTDKGRTIYVDNIEMLDGTYEEVRGYLSVEHPPGWVIYRWPSDTLAFPSSIIRSIATSEEPDHD